LDDELQGWWIMLTPLIFVVLAFLSLLLIIYLFRTHTKVGGDLDELAAQLRPIDVNAFRNLIDEREEQFLRERLPAREFRSVHRERMLAAAEYVWGAARNAGILVQLAEAGKADSDPTVASAAENLLENALHFRLYAFQVVPRLYLSALVPYGNHAPQAIAEQYDLMSRQMVMLQCLRAPAGGVSGTI
jgi:hypothetical protein